MKNRSGKAERKRHRHKDGAALFTTLRLIPEPPTGTMQFLGSYGPGVVRIAPVWSSILADVRPTRPQFIRHLPSPSAFGNCSGYLFETRRAELIETGEREERRFGRQEHERARNRVIMLMERRILITDNVICRSIVRAQAQCRDISHEP